MVWTFISDKQFSYVDVDKFLGATEIASNLITTTNFVCNGQANFYGTVNFAADVEIVGSLTVQQNFHCVINGNVDNDFGVGGDLNVVGTATVQNNFLCLMNGNVDSNFGVGGDLNVVGTATVQNNFLCLMNGNVDGDFGVGGDFNVVGTATVQNNFLCLMNGNVDGDFGIGGDLNVVGTANFLGNVGIDGNMDARTILGCAPALIGVVSYNTAVDGSQGIFAPARTGETVYVTDVLMQTCNEAFITANMGLRGNVSTNNFVFIDYRTHPGATLCASGNIVAGSDGLRSASTGEAASLYVFGESLTGQFGYVAVTFYYA